MVLLLPVMTTMVLVSIKRFMGGSEDGGYQAGPRGRGLRNGEGYI